MYKINDYIYEVYKEKSFTLAAKKLFVSQPALSASIKKVENELGIEIFDRSSKVIKPTEAGAIYIEYIESINKIEETFKNKLLCINNLKTGNVSIGGANFITSCVFPSIIQEFAKNYPGITINTIESNSEELKEKLLTGEIDLVIDYNFDKTLFSTSLLKPENVYLSCSKNSPLVSKLKKYAITKEQILHDETSKVPYVDFNDLKNEKFIILKKGNDMENRSTHIFKEHNIIPNVLLKLDQLMTAYNLSLDGLGIAFVTDTMITSSHNDDGVYFKIKSNYARRNIYIASKQNSIMRKSVKAFIDTAIDVMKKN